MRFKIKRTAAVLAAICVVIAVASSAASASAASWHAGGLELKAPTALASTTKSVEAVHIDWTGLNINCTGSPELKGAAISPTAGGEIEHLAFTGCESTNPSCHLKGTRLETKPLSMQVAPATGTEDTLTLTPKSGQLFIEIPLTGESCRIGTIKAEGQATFGMPKGTQEAAEQEIQVRSTTQELHVLTMSGAFKAKLSTGAAWSFR